mmetsp:Transcript_148926/g.260207  ORF Transcript_148926/g.260207 Transcript_148926/m.260207 type:complete len:1715 (-) Transcript_148926:474-5618(-)
MAATSNPETGGSVVLENIYDENYEPSPKEIREYALWLGMDAESDQDLFWIAREGLKAPLPDHWKACKTANGELYYFNFKSGASIWDHPMDEHYKKLFTTEKEKRDKENNVECTEPVKKEKKDNKETATEAKVLQPLKTAANQGVSASPIVKAQKADLENKAIGLRGLKSLKANPPLTVAASPPFKQSSFASLSPSSIASSPSFIRGNGISPLKEEVEVKPQGGGKQRELKEEQERINLEIQHLKEEGNRRKEAEEEKLHQLEVEIRRKKQSLEKELRDMEEEAIETLQRAKDDISVRYKSSIAKLEDELQQKIDEGRRVRERQFEHQEEQEEEALKANLQRMKEEKQRQFMTLVDRENESSMVKTKELQEEHAKMLDRELAKLTEDVEREKQEKIVLLRQECEQHLQQITLEEEKSTQTRLQELKEKNNRFIEEECSKMLEQEKQDALAQIKKDIELEVEAIKDEERKIMDAEVAKLRKEHANLIEEERVHLAKMLDEEKQQKTTKLKELQEENATLLETPADFQARKEKIENDIQKELEEFKAQLDAKVNAQKAELSLKSQQGLEDAQKLHEAECAQRLTLKEELTKQLEKDLADFELQLATEREGKRSMLQANHEEEIRTLTASFNSKLIDARQMAHAKLEQEEKSDTTKDDTGVASKEFEDFKLQLHEEHQRNISDLVKEHAEKETQLRQEMARLELKHIQTERDIVGRELKQIQAEKEVKEKEARLEQMEIQLNKVIEEKHARLDSERAETENSFNEKVRRKEEELSEREKHLKAKEKLSPNGVSPCVPTELIVMHSKQDLQFQIHEMEARHLMEMEELVTRNGHSEHILQARLASLDAMWLSKTQALEQKYAHGFGALEERHGSNLKRMETEYANKLNSKEKEVSSLQAQLLHMKKDNDTMQPNQIGNTSMVAKIDAKHDQQLLALQAVHEEALSQLKNKHEQELETQREAILTKLAKARSQLEIEQCDFSRRQEQQKAEREQKELEFATQMERVEAKFAALINEREQGLIQKLKNVKIEMESQIQAEKNAHQSTLRKLQKNSEEEIENMERVLKERFDQARAKKEQEYRDLHHVLDRNSHENQVKVMELRSVESERMMQKETQAFEDRIKANREHNREMLALAISQEKADFEAKIAKLRQVNETEYKQRCKEDEAYYAKLLDELRSKLQETLQLEEEQLKKQAECKTKDSSCLSRLTELDVHSSAPSGPIRGESPTTASARGKPGKPPLAASMSESDDNQSMKRAAQPSSMLQLNDVIDLPSDVPPLRQDKSPVSGGRKPVPQMLTQLFAESPRSSTSSSPMCNYDVDGPRTVAAMDESEDQVHLQLAEEKAKLQKARTLLRQQKKELKERQQVLQEARLSWKKDVLAARKNGMSDHDNRILNKVYKALEKQAVAINHDTEVLSRAQKWLLEREGQMAHLEFQLSEQHFTQLVPGLTDSSCADEGAAEGAAPYESSASRHRSSSTLRHSSDRLWGIADRQTRDTSAASGRPGHSRRRSVSGERTARERCSGGARQRERDPSADHRRRKSASDLRTEGRPSHRRGSCSNLYRAASPQPQAWDSLSDYYQPSPTARRRHAEESPGLQRHFSFPGPSTRAWDPEAPSQDLMGKWQQVLQESKGAKFCNQNKAYRSQDRGSLRQSQEISSERRRSCSKDEMRRSMILRNGGKSSGGDRDRDQDRGGAAVRNTLTAHRKWLHDISDQVGHMVV